MCFLAQKCISLSIRGSHVNDIFLFVKHNFDGYLGYPVTIVRCENPLRKHIEVALPGSQGSQGDHVNDIRFFDKNSLSLIVNEKCITEKKYNLEVLK